MVYKGKPSEGCGTCRKRRIKCDLQRPTCGQCHKSKRECLGYRDQTDLMFVHQTGAVQAKALGGRAKQPPTREVNLNELEDHFGQAMQLVPMTIPETPERQAFAFFFSEFLTMPRYEDTSRGHLEYILPFTASAGANSPLFDATAAAALASFAVKRPSQRLRQQSTYHYSKAVAALQEDIADEKLSRSDHTLMAILVLGFFESLVADASSIADWGHHADGALALVRYRGDAMLENPVSKKLWWAVRTQAVYSNVIKNIPLEPFLDWQVLWDQTLILPDENSARKLTALTSRIPCLRAGTCHWVKKPMSGEVALKCIDLIGYARVLDLLLAGWSFNVPAIWKPRVVGSVEGVLDNPETAEFYPGRIEVYGDLWAANILNAWRIFRAVCNMIVVNCLERLYPPGQLESIPEYENAVAIIQEMADGVCASIPYHMGYSLPAFEDPVVESSFFSWPTSPESSRDSSSAASSPDSTGSGFLNPDVGKLGGHYLILPLFFMYPMPTLPTAQRRWMAGRLRYIGKAYGSGQATALSNLCPPSNRYGRFDTNADFAPPPFVSFPDVYGIVHSQDYRDEEAVKDMQSLTAEARLFRTWRKDFMKRLLDL